MPNRERLVLAADLLRQWQDDLGRRADGEPDLGSVPRHEQDIWINRCGTACCAWGYLATRKEIKSQGVEISYGAGWVYYGGASGMSGIRTFFDIEAREVEFVFGMHHNSLAWIELQLRRLADAH